MNTYHIIFDRLHLDCLPKSQPPLAIVRKMR